MTPVTRRRRRTRKSPARRTSVPVRRSGTKPSHAKPTTRFVGRAASPVLDRYPKKDPDLVVRGPPVAAPSTNPPQPASASAPSATSPISNAAPAPVAAPTSSGAPKGLIALEKPFDVDEFSQLLGETTIRVVVPKEDLPEVLRRVSEFMGFGIYVYSFVVRPAPEELLKSFVVELQRVDFSAVASDWKPFQEQGRSDSPFGPLGRR